MDQDTNYPFKIYYPGGGTAYLISYYSWKTQEILVLAKTQSTAIKVFKEACYRHGGVQVNSFMEIEIVAPSDEMCEHAKLARHKKEIDDFYNEVAWGLRRAAQLGIPLPEGIRVCNNYEDRDYEEDNQELDEYHLDCKNCKNTIVLNETPESLYNKYYDKWRAIFPEENKAKHYISRARKVRPEEELWVALYNSKDSLQKISNTCIDADCDSIRFFFIVKEHLEIDSLNKISAEIDNKNKRSQEEKERILTQQQEQEELDHALKVLNIFKE